MRFRGERLDCIQEPQYVARAKSQHGKNCTICWVNVNQRTIHPMNVTRSAQNLIGLSSGCTFLSVLKAVESYPAQHLSLKHYRGLDCLLAGMMRSLDNSNSSSPPSGYTLAPLSIGARTQPLNCGLGSLHPRNYHFTIEH